MEARVRALEVVEERGEERQKIGEEERLEQVRVGVVRVAGD